MIADSDDCMLSLGAAAPLQKAGQGHLFLHQLQLLLARAAAWKAAGQSEEPHHWT